MEQFTAEQETSLEEVYTIEREAYEQEKRGELEASFSLRRQALALEESIVGPSSDYLATSLDSLAIGLYHAHHYAEAEALFRRALAIHRQVSGPESEDVAGGLQWLAFVYDDRKEYRKALQLFAASLRIRRQALGPDYDDKRKLLKIYADLLNVTGRRTKARAIRKRIGLKSLS